MKINKTLIALIITGTLFGCGGGDGNSNSDPASGHAPSNSSDGVGNASDTLSITPWSKTVVLNKMDSVELTKTTSNPETICEGRGQDTFETKDFIIGFDYDNTNFSTEDLERAARMTQVALDEHIGNTGLDKVNDLGITEQGKWVACLRDYLKDNHRGSAFKGGFAFTPETLDTHNDKFNESYSLVKHELFHVIQYAILPAPATGENIYTQYPRWFSEASAEFFAGKKRHIEPSVLHDYIDELKETPYKVNSYVQEEDVNTRTGNKYKNYMYSMYLTSFDYLVSHGLTFNDFVQLTENSSSVQQFDNAMSVVENGLTLPLAYGILRDSYASYEENVVENWLGYSASTYSYQDDIVDDIVRIFVMDKSGNKFGAWSVNSEQQEYDKSSKLPDGFYYLLAQSGKDEMYGPKEINVIDDNVGDIDFTGIGICTLDFCLGD